MRRTWIIDLAEKPADVQTSTGAAVDFMLQGYTRATGAGGFCWWHYQSVARQPGPNGFGQLNLASKIHAPEDVALQLDSENGVVILIGCAGEASTYEHYCGWASQLAALEPADLLGSPGTIEKIGILCLPEELFTAGCATDRKLAAFLVQLENAARCFDALYLIGNQKTSPELRCIIEIPAEHRPYLIAQLIQHLTMPEASRSELLSGICSAGVFALHACWDRFASHCEHLIGTELWRRFLVSEAPPFCDPRALDPLHDGFGTSALAEDWNKGYLAQASKGPVLPAVYWDIPAEHSPWKIWTSRLLDRGGFYEGWLRDWVISLMEQNARMSGNAMEDAEPSLASHESELLQLAGTALFQDFERLGEDSHPPRSKRQFEIWLERKARHLEDQQKSFRDSLAPLFSFPDQPVIHEMLDASRKDVETGRDDLEQATEIRGLIQRLKSHPSLLAMGVRAVFASTLLVILVHPVLTVVKTWQGLSILSAISPLVWMAMAFAVPLLAMFLSVRYRHNHIRQHAQKLTILELARLEEAICSACAARCRSTLEKSVDMVNATITSFRETCDHLAKWAEGAPPPASHPDLPITAFQRPLLDPDVAGLPKPVELMRIPNAEDKPTPLADFRQADYSALLTRLVSPSVVRPSMLVPYLERWVVGRDEDQVEDPINRVADKTFRFVREKIQYESRDHRDLWEKAIDPRGPYHREISLRSSPSVEKQQGHDISEGEHNRCSEELDFAGKGLHQDVRNLTGYASWMRYHRFPHLAAAIQNSRTVEAAKEWLETGLRSQPEVVESYIVEMGGILSIECQEWSIVEAGQLLAKIGAAEWRAGQNGYLAFEQDVDDGKIVTTGALVGRILSPEGYDPRLATIFEMAERSGRNITNLGGGQVVGYNKERYKTYEVTARQRIEAEKDTPLNSP